MLAATLAGTVVYGARAPLVERIGPVDYVDLVEICRVLHLRFVMSGDGRTITLHDGARRGVLVARSREMIFAGVRVFLGDAVQSRAGRLFVSLIDFERRLRPLWRADLAGAPPPRPRVIVLDPGHGGWDPGAVNKRYGIQEKKITLAVALRLEPLLTAQGWRVILTRRRDMALAPVGQKDPDLDARSAIALRARADVFLSIHFDASLNSGIQGSEIFSLTPTHQWASDDWESRDQARTGRSAALIYHTPFPGNRQDPWNSVLSHCLFNHLPGALRTVDLGERTAHWRVLEPLACPGVLIEPAYLSNDAEALRAASPVFQQTVAEALALGLRRYSAEIGQVELLRRDRVNLN